MTTSTPPNGASQTIHRSARLDLRGLGSYLAIAFGLTWAVEITALVVPGVRFDANPPPWAIPVIAGAMWFPAVAAFITRRWITREGFSSAGLRLGPWRAYLAIWLTMPLLFAAVYLVTWLLGIGRLDPELNEFRGQLKAMAAAAGRTGEPPPASVLLPAIFLVTMTLGLPLNCLFTFGEEFGWTGYLAIKLLPLGRWNAAIIYGLFWGLWHAPIIAIGYNYPGHPLGGTLFMCLLMVGVGLSQMALRLRYDSVLLTTFLHACLNAQGSGIWGRLVVGSDPRLGGITGVVGVAVVGAIGAWLLARSPLREGEAYPKGCT
jgi:uncharacterized protein